MKSPPQLECNGRKRVPIFLGKGVLLGRIALGRFPPPKKKPRKGGVFCFFLVKNKLPFTEIEGIFSKR